MYDAADWPTISALFDQALDLPKAEREGWLEALPESYTRFKPALAALLHDHARVETNDFLQKLPDIGTADDRSASTELYDEIVPGTTIIGPYRILRLLGRGGMGTVWLAERTDGLIKRPVALKLPHFGSGDSHLAERFARERNILAGLTHPHIARLYDTGLSKGRPYLALEYVEGIPIGAYCDAQELSLRQRINLFLQVVNAVQYAHSQLVVHRDLKPSNVLVAADGQVRLLDFGIAKLVVDGEAAETELTQLGGRALTPNYASPEQIAGLPIGTASDVYSLGVILYELLTGELPYRLKRDSRGALEEAILTADPPQPSTQAFTDATAKARATIPKKLADSLRGDLDTIVLKALKKAPDERYGTAQAFAEDIERYVRGEPVRAQPDRTWYRTKKLILRNKFVAASAAGAFAALAIGLGIALWQASNARVQAQLARDQATRAENEAKTAKAIQAMLEDIFQANSADQPDPLKAQQTTARELLDLGAKKLETSLQDQPAVRIAMLSTLANMYGDLSLPPKRLALSRERLELARKLYRDSDPALAEALTDLADAEFAANESGTERYFAEAEKILDGAGDFSSQTRGRLESQEARYYLYNDKSKVLSHADRAVRILNAFPPSAELLDAMWVKAEYSNSTGKHAEAEATAREALSLAATMNGKANSVMPMLYTQVALARDVLGDFAGSVEMRKEGLQLSERLYGADGPDMLDAGKNLGGYLCQTSHIAEGLEVLERTSADASKLVARGRTDLPSVVLAVDATCWTRFGQPERALERFRQIAEWRKDAKPQPSVDSALLGFRAETLIEIGDHQSAQAALGQASELSKNIGGVGNASVRRQARLLMSMGRYDDAAKAMDNYPVPEAETSVTLRSFELQTTRAELALLRGDTKAAAELASAILNVISKSPNRLYLKEHEARAAAVAGSALRLDHHPDQALAQLQHALDLDLQLYDPKLSPVVAQTQIALGHCYLDLGNVAEARRFFERAKAIHAAHKQLAPRYTQALRELGARLHVSA